MKLPHGSAELVLPLVLVGALLLLSGEAVGIGEDVALRSDSIFLEGSEVNFRVWWGPVTDATETVSVSCSRCAAIYSLNLTEAAGTDSSPAGGGRRYNDVRFPTDFPSALSSSEPKWNATYTIRVESDGTPSQTDNPATTFDVWAADVYRFPGGTLRTMDTLRIRAAGFPSLEDVTVKLERVTDSGLRTQVDLRIVKAGPTGLMTHNWTFPRSYAANLQCAGASEACLRHYVTISHGSKGSEELTFRVRPSNITVTMLAAPGIGAEPAFVNRTVEFQANFRLAYVNGDLFGPGDNTSEGLKVRLLQVDALGRVGVVGNDTARFATGANFWVVTPRFPKDLALTDATGFPKYRVNVPSQTDRYGNPVDPASSPDFSLTPATLGAAFLGTPRSMERLHFIGLNLSIAYPDDTPLVLGQNASELRVDLVRESDGKVAASLVANYTGAVGVWNVTYRPAIDFPDLGEHRLRLRPGLDKHGNGYNEAVTGAFTISVARPQVKLLTLVNGDEAGSPENPVRRLNQVDVLVFATYHDGTALNNSRLPTSSRDALTLNVTKAGEFGEVRGFFDLKLTLVDADRGKFVGTFTIPSIKDDPLGEWLFRVDERDRIAPEPNVVFLNVKRTVAGALISKVVVREPNSLMLAGSAPAFYSFALHYADTPSVPVDPRDASGRVIGTVEALLGTGQRREVAGPFLLEFNSNSGTYGFSWEHNRSSPVTSYQLRVSGGDRFGNEIEDTVSATFRLFIDQEPRSVITNPLKTVRRGEEALAVFEGAEGDTGEEGSAIARIEVQRFEASTSSWGLRLRDAKGGSGLPEEGFNHVGVFRTNLSTAEGVYRFALIGRNRTFATIVSFSENFTVVPVPVERQVLQLPPPEARKGRPVTAEVLRQSGDAGFAMEISRDGRREAGIVPQTEPTKFVLKWDPGEKTQTGAYVIGFNGRDAYGNPINITLGNVTLLPLELEVIPVKAPGATAQRNSEANITFQVRYPSRAILSLVDGAPGVNVYGPSGLVGSALVSPAAGNLWRAGWSPNTTMEIGDYEMRIEGNDSYGNVLVNNGTLGFRLTEGFAPRALTTSSTFINRTEDIAIFAPAEPGDVFVRFSLYEANSGKKVADLEQVPDLANHRYIARWRSAPGTPLIAYKALITGTDGFGNEIRGSSTQFGVASATIVSFIFEGAIEIRTGDPVTYSFTLTYPDGSSMTPQLGTPLATIGRGVTPDPVKPVLKYESGRWKATWQAAQDQKPTLYRLVLGGSDNFGNQIALSFSPPLAVRAGLIKELVGVPDVSPVFLLVGVAALSLVVKRRLS